MNVSNHRIPRLAQPEARKRLVAHAALGVALEHPEHRAELLRVHRRAQLGGHLGELGGVEQPVLVHVVLVKGRADALLVRVLPAEAAAGSEAGSNKL